MSDTDTVPELPLINRYTVPKTININRKTIESLDKYIQQLEGVAFAQQDHAHQKDQTILKLQDREREQEQKKSRTPGCRETRLTGRAARGMGIRVMSFGGTAVTRTDLCPPIVAMDGELCET